MADTGAPYNLPYQGINDAPDGPNLGEDLALALHAQLVRLDAVDASVAARLLNILSASVATEESTASGTYVALTTPGPAVTITTRTLAVAFWTARMFTSATHPAVGTALVGLRISGATTLASSTARAMAHVSSNGGLGSRVGFIDVFTVNAGSNTFTCEYAANGATASFSDRRLHVWAP